jgi:hypothetical protein
MQYFLIRFFLILNQFFKSIIFMKKLKFLSLLIFMMAAFMMACEEDDETPLLDDPIIELMVADSTFSDYAGTVGTELVIDVEVTAPNGLERLETRKVVNGTVDDDSPFTTTYTPTGASNDLSEVIEYTLSEEDIGEDVVLEFEAFDMDGNSTISEIVLTVENTPTVVFSTVLLSAPLADLSSETFFSTSTGDTYSVNEIISTVDPISEIIDFGYFYGETFNATLASPAAYPIDYTEDTWVDLNETKLKMTDLTSTEFLEYSSDVETIVSLFDDADFGSNEGQVRNLEAGDVIAFELSEDRDSRRGLILVSEIVEGAGENSYISIDVTVEQPLDE